MAAKSQIKVTANINFPRNDEIDGKASKTPRQSSFARGQTLTVGEELSKERADWLVSKGYAVHLSAKGEEVDDKGKPVGSKSDVAVAKATQEASAQHEKPVVEIPPGSSIEQRVALESGEAAPAAEAEGEAKASKSSKKSK